MTLRYPVSETRARRLLTAMGFASLEGVPRKRLEVLLNRIGSFAGQAKEPQGADMDLFRCVSHALEAGQTIEVVVDHQAPPLEVPEPRPEPLVREAPLVILLQKPQSGFPEVLRDVIERVRPKRAYVPPAPLKYRRPRGIRIYPSRRKEAKNDRFGTRLGSHLARLNTLLSTTPQSDTDIHEAVRKILPASARLPMSRVQSHLLRLFQQGHIVRTEEGFYCIPRGQQTSTGHKTRAPYRSHHEEGTPPC